MIQLFCFLLPPTIVLLLSAIRERKKKPVCVWLVQWLIWAVILYLGTAIVFLPFNRVAPRIGWSERGGSFLYIEYGSAAMLVLFALSVLTGIMMPAIHAKMHVSWEKAEAKTWGCITLRRIATHLFVLFALVLTYAYNWGLSNFGNVGMEEMVFHLHMPLEGTADSLMDNFFHHSLRLAIIAFAVFEILTNIPVKKAYRINVGKKNRLVIQGFPLRASGWVALGGILLWILTLVFCANQSFGLFDYAASQMKQSVLMEKEYVNPQTVQITFPEKKRNLITIYVESAETTNQDKANGGMFDVNYTPEMTRIAKENISFSHSHLLEGAVVAPACGWTIAGLVAETAGLPLKLYGQNDEVGGADNGLGRYSAFMPGATMLGDILGDAGYRLAFMCGSDLTFGGRREMYAQHGGYEVYDYLEAKLRGIIAKDYHEHWGFEDEKLYSWAQKVLTEFSSSDQPFHFALLTVDTHSPDGYLCSLCPNTYDKQLANALVCSSAQLDAFLKWCEQQPFYENTTVVVTGDHASMAPEFYSSEFDKYGGSTNRKVYNAFINSAVEPVQEENRLFTTMDFFPTTLASIGVQIEGDRLALGTNLFSDRETLSEQYGYEELFKQLSYKSLFYNNEILFP